jgi:hypothetical protein
MLDDIFGKDHMDELYCQLSVEHIYTARADMFGYHNLLHYKQVTLWAPYL